MLEIQNGKRFPITSHSCFDMYIAQNRTGN